MGGVGGLWADLTDLVLPTVCAGCRDRRDGLRHGVCPDCVAELSALRPRPVRPVAASVGLPSCHALGPYAGPLREALIAYKDHGRHGLARPLGGLLAGVVATAVDPARPVTLVPVPDTASAARARHGDHLARLARHCAHRLRRAGWSVRVRRPLRALPRPDSVGLDSVARAAAAGAAFRVKARVGGPDGATVVVLDDIVTTGSTLAAVSRALFGVGLAPAGAAVLAATVKRHPR
ncbi:Predicted amidophosphoribosyltransferases [Micromonospora nigra]|uniref:Predicted amidophosphoribosyltransferases n=1 Tax=Micromonospora nigra TaxID=145857 RepID=A0A1C6SFL7_9ACTN|nr:phosphoribosyltransferase family protein [Micromonospora nigra]SCL28264.1 Predicted amidophosphoribosyltransferases [Micromonospora nigra]